MERRLLLVLATLLLGPLAVASCAAIAGLGDVPPLMDGGSSDATKDSTLDGTSDATLDARMDVGTEAPHDAGKDAAMGCQGPADCPPGNACNLESGMCSTTCGEAERCNGGCCSATTDGLCVSGGSDTACGDAGTICASCSGDTPTCTDGVCTAKCSGAACGAGFCCTGTGTCVKGNSSDTCGSETACVNCTTSPRGTLCRSGKCGCDEASECPVRNACSTAHECTAKCAASDGSAPLECNGGCCGSTGFCEPGTGKYFCGAGGKACSDCASGNGKLCLDGGVCGCATENDCDPENACTNKKCSSACGSSKSSPCRGGCCDETTPPSTCVAGTANAACGDGGGTCADCTLTCTPGAACILVPDGGGRACGCTDNADCPSTSCGSNTTCLPSAAHSGVRACGS